MKILATLKAIWIWYAISRSIVIPRISCHLLIVYKLVMEEFWFSFHTQKKTNTDPNCIRPLCTHTHKHTELRKICFFFVFRSVPFYINESYKKYWKSTNTIFKKLIWDLIINSSSPCFVFIMCVFFYSLIQSIQKIRF